MATIIGIGFGTVFGNITGGGGSPGLTLITTDSTAHTIDTTTLYTVDTTNTSV